MFSSTPRTINLLIILFVCSAVLGFLHHFSGPRLSNVVYDNNELITEITMRANTQLREDALISVTIEPELEHEFTKTTREIVIRLQEIPRSDTTYTITATGITDTRGKTNTLKHQFTTPKASLVYLQRTDGANDLIIQQQLDGEEETLYESDRIYTFVKGDTRLLLLDGDDQGTPQLKSLNRARAKTIDTPWGTPSAIYGHSMSDSFIVSFDTADRTNTESYLYDARRDIFHPIKNEADTFIRISEAVLAEDGESIIYQDRDDFSLYIDNLFDTRPALFLDVVSRIVRYAPNNSGIAVEKLDRDPKGVSFIYTFSGETERIDLQTNVVRSTMSTLKTAYFIENVYLPDTLQLIYRLTIDGDKKQLASFESDARANDIVLSQQEDFISIETAATPVIFDRYEINSRANNPLTYIYTTDGVLMTVISGGSVQWLY